MRRLRKWIRTLVRSERGQAATEYVLVISVMVVAAVGATRPFVGEHGPFQTAMKQLSRNIGSAIAGADSPLLPGR